MQISNACGHKIHTKNDTYYVKLIVNKHVKRRWVYGDVMAESCQEWSNTQGQQQVLKIAKNTVEVHAMWHDIYVDTGTGGLLCANPCACARGTGICRDAQLLPPPQFFANKSNRDAQTNERWGTSMSQTIGTWSSFKIVDWNLSSVGLPDPYHC